jgi:hypothetical protein
VSVRSWAEQPAVSSRRAASTAKGSGAGASGAAARGWVVVEVAVVGAGKVVIMAPNLPAYPLQETERRPCSSSAATDCRRTRDLPHEGGTHDFGGIVWSRGRSPSHRRCLARRDKLACCGPLSGIETHQRAARLTSNDRWALGNQRYRLSHRRDRHARAVPRLWRASAASRP